jgi:phage-related protein
MNKKAAPGTAGWRRRWRFYGTASGREPVREFLDDRRLSDIDAAAIAAAMKEVREVGRAHADVNNLHGDIWQIEIDGQKVIYRLLFAEEGRFGQVLLALELVNKKWQKAKVRHIRLAEERLADWRQRDRRTPKPPV